MMTRDHPGTSGSFILAPNGPLQKAMFRVCSLVSMQKGDQAGIEGSNVRLFGRKERRRMNRKASIRLTEDMKRVITEQRLGFVASVCPDGTPNLSPKGTTTVWDDDHLIFADICSPGTVANVQLQPVVEINVVDPVARKGYRFKGPATVYQEGPFFEQAVAFYRERGTTSPIQHIVLVKVEHAVPLISPVYDQGKIEEQVRQQWLHYWQTLYAHESEAATLVGNDG
jgi:predicted pyridoxine 5'-phosphate oxidase superfamily flavin-nucleotide-binding protein